MKFAVIDLSSSGDSIVVAGVSNRRIRVVSYTLISDAAVTVTWKSGSTAISGPMSLAANGGMAPNSAGLSPAGFVGLFETDFGTDLVIGLSAAVAVGGHISYVLA